MNKKFKIFIILPLMLLGTEILNSLILLLPSYFASADIKYIIMPLVSLVMYYLIGRNVISKIIDDKYFKISAVATSLLLIFSCLFSEYLTEKTGEYLIIHQITCSPISNLILWPFGWFLQFDKIQIVYSILSPISVLLICIVALKYKNKSRNNS